MRSRIAAYSSRIRWGRRVGLSLQAAHHVLHVLVELAQGVPVGGHGEPVGVRDPYPRSAGGVLGQGVYASRRLTADPSERGDVLRGHGEHQLSLLDHSLAHPPGAIGLGVESRLLERREGVLGHGPALQRRGPRALRLEGEGALLGQGIEHGCRHRAAADVCGTDEENLLHEFAGLRRVSNVDTEGLGVASGTDYTPTDNAITL